MIRWLSFFAVLFSFSQGMVAQPVDRNGDLPPISRESTPCPILDNRNARDILDETYTHIDPGIPPEGDYMGALAFSTDGNKVFVLNRETDNFTVFDWQTMSALATISTGTYPSDIAVTDDRIIISCAFSDEVRIYSPTDYSQLATISTGEQPWVVHNSNDGHYAFVACDISNTCEMIDLETLTLVRSIPDFPIGLRTWSANSASGRNDFGFTDFLVSPDGQYLVADNCENAILFFSTATGELTDSITGIPNCAKLALSGDSATLVAASPTSPGRVYRIDLATRAIEDSVVLTGYNLSFEGLAVNQDGSKCFLGVDNNQSAIVRFASHDFVTFTQTYTAFWVGVMPGHRYVISGQYNFSVVDFVTEQVVGQAIGHSQYRGETAPVGMRVASHSPFGTEGVFFFDIQTPSSPQYRGLTLTGLAPEGDAPHHAAITPDGSRAVVSNFLSNNVSIINLSNLETEDIIENVGDGPWEVAVTSDSRWAVVCGYNSNAVHIIDLQNLELVATVPTNLRPCTVLISPDDAAAYIGNIQANTISIIALDGANSSEVAEIPCGVIGVLWASYGVFSGMALSPDGLYLLVAASFDDQVKVIDTWTQSVVASLSVGDFPLQLSFADNEYAVVTNYFSNDMSVLHIDGSASEVVGTYPIGNGPLRLAYNPAQDVIGIALLSDQSVKRVNPRTGAIVGTTDFSAFGSVLQVAYGSTGDEVVLTSSNGTTASQLNRDTEHTELPAYPANFTLTPDGNMAVVTMPGPDYVTVVQYEAMNHPPTPFSLILPENNDTVDFVEPGLATVVWQSSHDPDAGETATYSAQFRLLSSDVDTTIDFSALTDTTYTLSLMDSAGISTWTHYVRVQWLVRAISNGDTVDSREQWIFRLAPRSNSVGPALSPIPAEYSFSVYPNPFNPITTLEFALPRAGHVEISLYDLTGRLVETLMNKELPEGVHRISLDGSELPAGMYFVRMSSREFAGIKKIVLLK